MSVTAYNRPPYFDDFNTPDTNNQVVTDKGYYRILFSPAYAVQNRELNQLQTMLQDQIDKFGLSVFENGSRVIEGEINFTDNVPYIDVENLTTDFQNFIDLQKFIETQEIDASTGEPTSKLKAQIVFRENLGDGVYRLWLSYLNSFNQVTEFQPNDELFLSTGQINTSNNPLPNTEKVCEVNSNGVGFAIENEPGVFFLKGYFVAVEGQAQYFVKNSRSTTVNGSIIFQLNENIITSETDSTLLDNANGSFNFAAPGADRYQIVPQLAFLVENSSDFINQSDNQYFFTTSEISVDYAELLSITQSSVFTKNEVNYSQLDDLLATRTFEESGNYTVRPFVVSAKELLRENQNGGKYTLTDIENNNYFGLNDLANTEQEARNRIVLDVEPSVAYVSGYRVELNAVRPLPIQKTSTIRSTDNVFISMPRGNYVDLVYDKSTGTNTTFFTDDSDKIRNLTFVNDIDIDEPEGETRAGWHRYRAFVFNDFKPSEYSLPTGFDYRYLPGTIEGGSPITDKTIKNSQENSSIFPITYRGVSSVRDLVYRKQKLIIASNSTNDGTNTTFDFVLSSPEGFDAVNRSDLVIFNNDNNQYLNPLDEIVDLPSVTNGTSTSTLSFALKGTGFSSASSISIITSVRVSVSGNTLRRAKTLVSGYVDSFQESTQKIELSKEDVVLSTIQVTDSSTSEVVSHRVIDDGQHPNFYDKPVIELLDSSVSSFDITYDYFQHGAGEYFTVNSYEQGVEDFTTWFERIPLYDGRRLSDFIDYRVKRSAASSSIKLTPNSVASVNIDHYLPRRDTLYVNRLGEFYVKTGIPDINPKKPETVRGDMRLYEIGLKPYVYGPEDVLLSYIDNTRYTMSDISDIEKRVNNLEYYSSLSFVEEETRNKKIFDLREETAGLERFKNGILVDTFNDHSVGDTRNPDYLCSIDRTRNHKLEPYFTSKNFRFQYNAPTGFDKSQLYLSNSKEVLYENLDASQTLSVQPYEVTVWEGKINLSPKTDEWVDTETRPSTSNVGNVLNLISEATSFIAEEAEGVLGFDFGSWVNTNISVDRETETLQPFIQGQQLGAAQQTTTTTIEQTRAGSETTLSSESIELREGERVVDLSIIPFVRSRDISFRATGLKPNTRVYAFFDDENITEWIDASVSYQLYPVNADVNTYENTLVSDLPASFGGPLFTDENGSIEGRFRIPNNADLRFQTGQRVFRITDNAANNLLESDTFAKAKYTAQGFLQTKESPTTSIDVPEFTVSPVEESRTLQRTSTRRWTWDPIAQTFFVDSQYENGIFLSDIDVFFATKTDDLNTPVDIYIVPVENGIPTTDILPGSRVSKRPSEVVVTGRNLENVQTSETIAANYATNFVFDNPIYLESGREYAVVVFSKTVEYRVWTSNLGGVNIENQTPITKNPAFGVLLKSQNGRTWTPDQRRDLMVRFNKYTFTSNTTEEFTFTTKINGFEFPNNFAFSIMHPFFETLSLPNTSIDFELDFYDGETQINNEGKYLLKNKENYFFQSEDETKNATEARVTARLQTTDSNISPVINLDRTSLIGIQFKLNNDSSGEDSSSGGNAISRYITKPVQLTNPSEDLRVILAVNRPSDAANIEVYAKRKPLESSELSFANEVSWQKMSFYSANSNLNTSSIPITTNENDYSEVEYILPDPNPSNLFVNAEVTSYNSGTFEVTVSDASNLEVGYTLIAKDDGSRINAPNEVTISSINSNVVTLSGNPGFSPLIDNEDTLIFSTNAYFDFTEFAIKIVFLSSDVAQRCKIKDLRAIASV
jgi:hypothetical protein